MPGSFSHTSFSSTSFSTDSGVVVVEEEAAHPLAARRPGFVAREPARLRRERLRREAMLRDDEDAIMVILALAASVVGDAP